MADEPTILIALPNTELAELKAALPAGSARRRAVGSADGATAGDLGLTTAIVIVTVPVIHALAVWLAKRRTSDSHEEALEFERDADGSVRITVRRTSRGTSSSPPSAATVEALRSQLSEITGLLDPR